MSMEKDRAMDSLGSYIRVFIRNVESNSIEEAQESAKIQLETLLDGDEDIAIEHDGADEQ